MRELVSTVVDGDNISEYTVVTLVAIGVVTALLGLIVVVSPDAPAWPADAPSPALFFN